MIISKEISLDEQDVRMALCRYIRNETGLEVDENELVFITGVRGDYDRGDAEEYIERVYFEAKNASESGL